MRLSDALLTAAICGLHLPATGLAISPRVSLLATDANDFFKRVVIDPVTVPKPAPKPIIPGDPKTDPVTGKPCARSWLWSRTCSPPIDPNSNSPGSGHSGDSQNSLLSTISLRLLHIDTDPGYNQILPPQTYVDRGNAILKQNADAASANPRVDKAYDDWSVRYNRLDYDTGDEGVIPSQTMGSGLGNDMRTVLGHPDIGLNADKKWTYVSYASKSVDPKSNDPKLTSIALVDKEGKAIMASESDSSADTDPPSIHPTPAKLYNSELLYQTWRDENAGVKADIRNLRFMVRMPIANAGTRITIKDAFTAKGFGTVDREAGTKATFYPHDNSYTGILGDAWGGLAGTVNGRPAPLIGADHADSLDGLQVIKIHAWYNIPDSPGFSALIFEFGRL